MDNELAGESKSLDTLKVDGKGDEEDAGRKMQEGKGASSSVSSQAV